MINNVHTERLNAAIDLTASALIAVRQRIDARESLGYQVAKQTAWLRLAQARVARLRQQNPLSAAYNADREFLNAY